MQISKTKLYRAMYRKLREDDDWEEIKRNIKTVKKVDWDVDAVSKAFFWSLTPQGRVYWRDIHNRMYPEKGFR